MCLLWVLPEMSPETNASFVVIFSVLEAAHLESASSTGQTWTERQESETQSWEAVRPSLFGDIVSSHAVPMSGEYGR